jgi:hypothetical protein
MILRTLPITALLRLLCRPIFAKSMILATLRMSGGGGTRNELAASQYAIDESLCSIVKVRCIFAAQRIVDGIA